jgi:biotin carboxyl carrier protein
VAKEEPKEEPKEEVKEPPKEDPSFVPVSVVEEQPEPIKAKSAGKVTELIASNGVSVQKGAALFVIEGVEADKAQIATLKESIAALEEIAKNNERAKKQLEQDKAELARLQSQKAKMNVTAPSTGNVDLIVAVGAVVKAGQVVGKISQPAKVKVTTSKPVSACALKTASGVKDGTVVSSMATEAIIALPPGLAPGDVTGARCQ